MFKNYSYISLKACYDSGAKDIERWERRLSSVPELVRGRFKMLEDCRLEVSSTGLLRGWDFERAADHRYESLASPLADLDGERVRDRWFEVPFLRGAELDIEGSERERDRRSELLSW